MENKTFSSFFILFLALGFLVSCATTKITAEAPGADIYMDSKWIGRGEAQIGSIGPPRTSVLEAKKAGRTLGKTTMSRSFKFKTVLWGLVSYYTGFYWGWYYPNSIVIPFAGGYRPADPNLFISPWDQPSLSVWSQPLHSKPNK